MNLSPKSTVDKTFIYGLDTLPLGIYFIFLLKNI